MIIVAVGFLIIASVCAAVLTVAVKNVAFRRNWVGQAMPHHGHDGPIPRLGGISVFVTVLVVGSAMAFLPVPWTAAESARLIAVFVAGGIVFAIGLWDDFSPIFPLGKAVVEVVAAVVLYLGGFRIESLPPITGSLPALLSFTLTVLWVLGITNAFNLIDGLDGLASGSALISSIALGILFTTAGRPEFAVLSLVLAGALAGFLKFNFSPAVIFLGDCGSLFVGFMMSALGLMLFSCIKSPAVTLIPLLVFGLPVLDTVLAIVRRTLKRQPIYMPDREHMHHQLLARGFSVSGAAILLYGISAFFCATGVLLVSVPDHSTLLLSLPLVCFASCFVGFGYHKYVPELQKLSSIEIRAMRDERGDRALKPRRLDTAKRSRINKEQQAAEPALSGMARGTRERQTTGVAFSDD